MWCCLGCSCGWQSHVYSGFLWDARRPEGLEGEADVLVCDFSLLDAAVACSVTCTPGVSCGCSSKAACRALVLLVGLQDGDGSSLPHALGVLLTW